MFLYIGEVCCSDRICTYGDVFLLFCRGGFLFVIRCFVNRLYYVLEGFQILFFSRQEIYFFLLVIDSLTGFCFVLVLANSICVFCSMDYMNF